MSKKKIQNNYPETLSILGKTIRLVIVEPQHKNDEGEELDGEFCAAVGVDQVPTIYISGNVAEHRKQGVIFHELTHACLYYTGLSDYIEKLHIEEMFCTALENLSPLFELKK